MCEKSLVTSNFENYFFCEPRSSKFRIYVCKTRPILCQILGTLIEIKSPEQAWFSGVVDIIYQLLQTIEL